MGVVWVLCGCCVGVVCVWVGVVCMLCVCVGGCCVRVVCVWVGVVYRSGEGW